MLSNNFIRFFPKGDYQKMSETILSVLDDTLLFNT